MSSRDRRALLIGGAIIVATIVMLRLVPWIWHAAYGSVDQLRARAAVLARARAEIRGAKALEDSAARIRGQLIALAPKILSGNTSSEAVADLVGRITIAAERHRARLERTDVVPDSARGGELRRVAVHGVIEGDTRGMLGFLGALAVDPLVLTVDQVRIMALDPSSVGTAPEVLRMELTVYGWYLYQKRAR